MTRHPSTTLHCDRLFAPLDYDLHLQRIAGGNETEVYTTDDQRFVVKVKSTPGYDLATTLRQSVAARRSARKFARIVGKQHSIATHFMISRGDDGTIKAVVLQPYLAAATALFRVDYKALSDKQRRQIAKQLLHIVYRSALAFTKGGVMPDLYGRASTSAEERKRLNAWHQLPQRLWSFLVKRNLLRAHNLLLTHERKPRIVLVDYDAVPHGKLYQLVYYYVRMVLFMRDLALIAMMVVFGVVPTAE